MSGGERPGEGRGVGVLYEAGVTLAFRSGFGGRLSTMEEARVMYFVEDAFRAARRRFEGGYAVFGAWPGIERALAS